MSLVPRGRVNSSNARAKRNPLFWAKWLCRVSRVCKLLALIVGPLAIARGAINHDVIDLAVGAFGCFLGIRQASDEIALWRVKRAAKQAV